MKCRFCNKDQIILQAASLNIEKDGKKLHVKNAPVFVCRDCGEKYIDDAAINDIEKAIGIAFSTDAGATVEIKCD